MTKQNFYQGQRVGPEEMNGITACHEESQGHLVASTLGLGLVQGYGAEIISGFVAGIAPGLAYNSQGRPLILASGAQVNLAAHTPAVGNKTVLLGLVPALIEDSPATDSMGNAVFRQHTDAVEFVHGASLPEKALPLYEVNLSPVGIISFKLVAPALETPLAQSQRTRGYAYNGGNPKISAPNGFEVDLLTLATRRAVFDALKPEGYKKGDILWLEPSSYDTQTTPPAGGSISYPYTVPAAEAFMGKARTYSAQTNFRQYAVRLRAMVDNPRNPNIMGAIGTDWAVDDPSAIVEEGSNANGSYTMYAGGKTTQNCTGVLQLRIIGAATAVSFTFPIKTTGTSGRRVSAYLKYISGVDPSGTIGFLGDRGNGVLSESGQTLSWSFGATGGALSEDCYAYVSFYDYWY